MTFSISRAGVARRTVLVLAVLPILIGATQDIRVVTYNTQDDVGTGGDTGPTPTTVLQYLPTVIEGIGQQKYVGDNILQLPDVIALQETTSNSTTVVPLVNSLNSFYGNSNFNYSSYQATTSDGTTYGGGPNALIYNQATMHLMASVGVGTPNSAINGEYRQIVRYEFQPVADLNTSNGVFYVYDSHYKSGAAGTTPSGSSYNDGQLRNLEAQIVRNDEAANLPSTASVIYVGDYNGDGSTETAYQTITATSSPSGVNQGAGIDPRNVANNYGITWTANNSNGLLTETDTSLYYRDDLQVMTANIYNGSGGGLHYISGSYHTFGNDGSLGANADVASGTSTALNDIVGNGSLAKATVFAAMNGSIGSDHLPVVADYSIVILANGLWSGGVGNWSNAALWSNSTVPNDSSVEVKIDNSNPVASVVTMDTTATIQDISIDANDALNLTATHVLTISGAPVSLFNGTFTNTGTLTAGSIINTGNFNSSGTFTATGNFNNSGTAAFGGTQSWSSGTLLLNIAGTTTFNSNASASTLSPLTLNVNVSAGSVVFNASQSLLSLTLANGSSAVATIQSNHSNHTLITLGTLNFASATNSWQGRLDLGGNDLDVQTATLVNITAQVRLGFNNGAWNGSNGITSAAALADTRHLTALGVIQNNQSGSALYISSNPFDGTTPGAGDILVKYTYYGDADLNGKIDATDYARIDSGYVTHATGWYNGDFNYDGVINGSDYTLIDNAFNTQGATLALAIADPSATDTGEIAPLPLPEPTTLGLLTIAATCLIGRRRTSRRRLLSMPYGHPGPARDTAADQ